LHKQLQKIAQRTAAAPSLAKIASLSFLLTGKQRACELSKYCQRAVKWLVPGFVPRQIRAPSLVAQRCRLITAIGQINERETPSSLTNRRQRCPCPPVYNENLYTYIAYRLGGRNEDVTISTVYKNNKQTSKQLQAGANNKQSKL